MIDRLVPDRAPSSDCTCDLTLNKRRVLVDADQCPRGGDLRTAPACRAAVAATIRDARIDAVIVRTNGRSRHYHGDAAEFLDCVATTAALLHSRDPKLATRLRHHPISAGQDAVNRAGAVGELTQRTGLADWVQPAPDLDAILVPATGPTIADARITKRPPETAELRTHRSPTEFTDVRIYETPDAELPTYHLDPPATRLTDTDCAILAAAKDTLAEHTARGDPGSPATAIGALDATPDTPPEELSAILRKHTTGFGVLADLFADPEVSDVYAPAPVNTTPLRVEVADETMRTNTYLTTDGAAALASKLRQTSGKSFSRATPTLDAEITVGPENRPVRATAVTEPASDGNGFAFRGQHQTHWTLPALIANDTLSPWAAALLSVAVERGGALIIAGARGAGKTTLLAALLWELPPATRLITIEDTPELPVTTLQEHDRDVQALHTQPEGFDATTALRSALRMGEGALAIGEVRGEEATVLYEAMRVGAQASAVLGTIHGNRADGVRERVVTDLGVPNSSFAVTDLVITVEHTPSAGHDLATIEEITGPDPGDAAPLYTTDGPTGRIARGSSITLPQIAHPGEAYAAINQQIQGRETFLTDLADAGRTDPAAVVRSHAARRTDS